MVLMSLVQLRFQYVFDFSKLLLKADLAGCLEPTDCDATITC
jgi:hypothetical protein